MSITACSLRDAEELRLRGNDHFKASRIAVAAESYQSSLNCIRAAVEASEGGPDSPPSATWSDAVSSAQKSLGNLCTCLHMLPSHAVAGDPPTAAAPHHDARSAFANDCFTSARAAMALDVTFPKAYFFLAVAGAAVDPPLSPAAEGRHQNSTSGGRPGGIAIDGDESPHMSSLLAATIARYRHYSRLLQLSFIGQWLSPLTSSTKPMLDARSICRAAMHRENSVLLRALADRQQQQQTVGGPPLISVATDTVVHRNGLVACQYIPLGAPLLSLKHPFSVGYYDPRRTGAAAARETHAADHYYTNAGDVAKLCICCGTTFTTGVGSSAASLVVPRTCATCGLVKYCGIECQMRYASRHSWECGHFRTLESACNALNRTAAAAGRDSLAPELYELAAHTITTLSGIVNECPGWEVVKDLEGHADELATSQGATVAMVVDVLSSSGLPPRMLAHVAGITYCNSLQAVDRTGLGVGQLLYGNRVTYLNHSCDPNAAIDTEEDVSSLDAPDDSASGPLGVIRAMRPLSPGEEVTISYIPQLYYPRDLRRRALEERYFFSCKCPRCSSVDTPAARRGLEGALVVGDISSAAAYASESSAASRLRRALQLWSSAAASSRVNESSHSPDLAAQPWRLLPVASVSASDVHRATEYLLHANAFREAEWRAKVVPLATEVRECDPDDISPATLSELTQLRDKILPQVGHTSYLLQDLNNAMTFAGSVLGDATVVIASAAAEYVVMEALVEGALPAKVDKLRNLILALDNDDAAPQDGARTDVTTTVANPSVAAIARRADLIAMLSLLGGEAAAA